MLVMQLLHLELITPITLLYGGRDRTPDHSQDWISWFIKANIFNRVLGEYFHSGLDNSASGVQSWLSKMAILAGVSLIEMFDFWMTDRSGDTCLDKLELDVESGKDSSLMLILYYVLIKL